MIRHRFDRNALTLFDDTNGTKVRLAVGTYLRAGRPELVDLKITDYCAFGCTFCYQGSTKLGKHATWDNLETVVAELKAAKVFEVAIGGGEPTDHPDFVRLLKAFRDAGVVPNFTTKYPAVVRKLWPEIHRYVGAFAYSAETVTDILAAKRHFDSAGIPRKRVNLHYVMGLHDSDHFKSYLRAAHKCGYRVTLLGYKTTGRGGDVIPVPYEWWMSVVSELVDRRQCPDLSIDTPLAAAYAGDMPVAERLFHTQEGAFSMYIDAVAMTYGASSFEPGETLLPFTSNWIPGFRQLVLA